MILLVIGASVLIAAVSIYQYREEAVEYHRDRLERKETAIRENINYVLKTTTYPVDTENIPLIFRTKIYEIKDIHNLELYIYDLDGGLLKSSKASLMRDTTRAQIPSRILSGLEASPDKKFIEQLSLDGQDFQSSYSYITDLHFKPLAILNLPYIEEDDFITRELKEFLTRLAQIYLLMLLVAIGLAYFLSKYITKSLNSIIEKMNETSLGIRNKKILVNDPGSEIASLVNAYNSMIDELEVSAAMLASNEREAAWREMAKQVAHEIKNPLTPMRLSVQSFDRKFDPSDPKISEKVKEYSNTLIQQIDTMSSIASAFSTYAEMPAQQDETLNVVKITKLALDIFNEHYIHFEPSQKEIIAMFDRTQLIRVITNLVKNSIQALQSTENPRIEVKVFTEQNNVVITVADNGSGISEENKPMVFEPKFTTKTSGMGLGLAMVKNIVDTYGGSITFESKQSEKTMFTVTIPQSKTNKD
ncbi:MAG: ATP-binding protein [Gilvibacter sp.]